MVERPHNQPALPLTPEQLRQRRNRLQQETTATAQKQTLDNANRIATMPHAQIYATLREQSMQQLERFHGAKTVSASELNPHLQNLRRMAEWEQVEPMIAALTATPPRVPGAPGSSARRTEEVDEPDEMLARYLLVQNESIRGDGDDIQLVSIGVRPRIFQDLEIVRTLKGIYAPRPPEHRGDPELARALTTLEQRLENFAQLDAQLWAEHRQSLNQGYMNEAFGTMGKLAACIALAAYTAANVGVALANGQMPTVGLLSGLGLVLIADRRIRNQMFRPADRNRLDHLDAVLTGLGPFANNYQIYQLDGAWSDVFRRILDDREQIVKDFADVRAIRDPERKQKETANLANRLSTNDDVRKHLVAMMNATAANGGTHFDTLLRLLNISDDDTQTAIVNIVRMRATGRVPGRPAAAPTPPRPAGGPTTI